MNLPDITKVESHDLQPGDLVVISTSNVLARQQVERMYGSLEAAFPQQKILILDAGMTMDVYRDKQAGAQPT
jgi:hypothetical protein